MYELRQLRTFQAVAARQSVTRAAAALGYAQSSMTAQIQALEEDVGFHAEVTSSVRDFCSLACRDDHSSGVAHRT